MHNDIRIITFCLQISNQIVHKQLYYLLFIRQSSKNLLAKAQFNQELGEAYIFIIFLC